MKSYRSDQPSIKEEDDESEEEGEEEGEAEGVGESEVTGRLKSSQRSGSTGLKQNFKFNSVSSFYKHANPEEV